VGLNFFERVWDLIKEKLFTCEEVLEFEVDGEVGIEWWLRDSWDFGDRQ